MPSGKIINLNSCEISLFSNRNCCDSKHFVSLLQNIFIKMRKYFLAFCEIFSKDDCNAGDREMIDVDDGHRAGSSSSVTNRLAVNYTILDEKGIQA